MRHPQLANHDDTALLIVDIQEKLMPQMDQREALLRNVTMLIATAKKLEMPIVVTEHYSKGLGPTTAAVAEALGQFKPIEKITFSCLGEARVPAELARLGRPRIIVTGIETHVCIAQTALDLAARGYTPYLPIDATSSRRKPDRQTGVERMRSAGVVITTSEAIVFELLERAGTDVFKALMPLFK